MVNGTYQEEQKILDKHMGRPEKPPSSAYSLFRYNFNSKPGHFIRNFVFNQLLIGLSLEIWMLTKFEEMFQFKNAKKGSTSFVKQDLHALNDVIKFK